MNILEFKDEINKTEREISKFISDQLLFLEMTTSIPIDFVSIKIDRIMESGKKCTYHYSIETQLSPDFKA